MEFARNAMAKQTGFDRLAQDCGVEDLVVRQWVERIRAVMPHTGAGIVLVLLDAHAFPGWLCMSHEDVRSLVRQGMEAVAFMVCPYPLHWHWQVMA